MQQLAKLLIVVGVSIAAMGVVLYLGNSLSFLGRLPGDIRLERPNFKFYFPITTSILLSILLSAILYLISRFR